MMEMMNKEHANWTPSEVLILRVVGCHSESASGVDLTHRATSFSVFEGIIAPPTHDSGSAPRLCTLNYLPSEPGKLGNCAQRMLSKPPRTLSNPPNRE